MNNKLYSNRNNFSLFTGVFFILLTGVSCKKEPSPEPVFATETGIVTDIDGNIYKTIKIGNQWWMAENLRTRHYQDSTAVLNNESPFAEEERIAYWKKDTSGMACNTTIEIPFKKMGLLYNWYAVANPKGIAPKGWRIPSDEDWKELERQLGMTSDDANKTSWRGTHEGEKLMVDNSENTMKGFRWTSYGENHPTNESEFTALPAGYRMFDGTKKGMVTAFTAFFWSSTLHGNDVWYRYLDYKQTNVFRYYGPKSYGFSIRCIKN